MHPLDDTTRPGGDVIAALDFYGEGHHLMLVICVVLFSSISSVRGRRYATIQHRSVLAATIPTAGFAAAQRSEQDKFDALLSDRASTSQPVSRAVHGGDLALAFLTRDGG